VSSNTVEWAWSARSVGLRVKASGGRYCERAARQVPRTRHVSVLRAARFQNPAVGVSGARRTVRTGSEVVLALAMDHSRAR
jgi:hypothetical protein